VSWQTWSVRRAADLDEIENAHRSVGGTGRGRRVVTQQINQAYGVLLSSHFQAFCRDLHTECAEHLVAPIALGDLRKAMLTNLLFGRKLDQGNPNPGNIGSDFNRLQLPFWSLVDTENLRNRQRRQLLEEVNNWRNAIAHQAFASAMLKGARTALQLMQVQGWRRACEGLAKSFDVVLHGHVRLLTGSPPW
jgi:hypothetical protein